MDFLEGESVKLLQGDCLDIMRSIPTSSVDLVLTDPPYGTTRNKWDSIIDLELTWKEVWRVLKPNGAVAMTASQPFTTSLISSNINNFRYCLVWEKQKGSDPLNAKRKPLKSHEDIVVFYRKQPTYNPQFEAGKSYTRKGDCSVKSSNFNGAKKTSTVVNTGKRYPKSVLKFSSEGMNKGSLHPTQKPVALMEYLIKTYTDENETVLDFTMGSGSTGVAAKNLNRRFVGIELDPDYFAIAKNRIENT